MNYGVVAIALVMMGALPVLADLHCAFGLYQLNPGMEVRAQDYNVLALHIQELERVVKGLQKQVTVLHSKTDRSK